ncbi:MAG: YjbQ family protein [Propionibacteriaceae bacterium]|nr:YjbQ family protein [Propionibacteriaceae bacterium]
MHGCQLLLPIDGGKLGLGHLQRVFFVEADGPRQRKVQLRVLGQ